MNDEQRELKKIMSELVDEELLRIVNVDYADYRPDAVDCAKQELVARGVPLNPPPIISKRKLPEQLPSIEILPEDFFSAPDKDYPGGNYRLLWSWRGWARLFVIVSLSLTLGALISSAQIWRFKSHAVA